MRAVQWILIVALSAPLSACIEPEFPSPEAPPPPPVQPLSDFSTNISIANSDLERLLNRMLEPQPPNNHWIEKNGIDLGDFAKADVTGDPTYGNFHVSGNAETLHVGLNFHLHAHAHRDKWPHLTADCEMDGKVWVDTTLALTGTWRIASSTRPDFNLSNAKCHAAWFPHISLKDLLSSIIRPEMPKIGAKIDEKLASYDFSRNVATIWGALQKPVPLGQSSDMWLVLDPRGVAAGLFHNTSSHVAIDVGVYAKPVIVLSPDPPPATDNPVPPLDHNHNLGNAFHIHLRVAVTYAEANRLLDKNFAGRAIDLGHGARFIANRISTFGNGRRLVVKVDFGMGLGLPALFAGICPVGGTLYLMGVPTYDPASRTVRLEDVDFSADTQNLLLKNAAYLLHSAIQRELQQAFKLEVGDKLDDARSKLQKVLDGTDISANARLSGTLTSMEPVGIFLNADGLLADFDASGTDQIEIH